MSKLFPLDWFEVQRFLKKSHVSSKIDLEISDKRVTFQGIFEVQIDLEEKVLASYDPLHIRVISDLALIIYGQKTSKSLFVGFE